MDQLQKLFAHLAWADERAVGALRAAATPPEDALRLMAHVLGTEHVWLARLHQRPAEVPVWPDFTVDDCARLARENHEAFRRLLDALDPAALREEIPYRNSAGIAFRSTREDILLHVALHGMYHRGQVAIALRRAGLAPAPTDFIEFTRGAPAATGAPVS